VSKGSGTEPLVWSRDGTSLYYRSNSDGMAMRIVRTPELAAESPRELFADVNERQRARNFDLLPTGEFVMVRSHPGRGTW
jgi:hypothetical protein